MNWVGEEIYYWARLQKVLGLDYGLSIQKGCLHHEAGLSMEATNLNSMLVNRTTTAWHHRTLSLYKYDSRRQKSNLDRGDRFWIRNSGPVRIQPLSSHPWPSPHLMWMEWVWWVKGVLNFIECHSRALLKSSPSPELRPMWLNWK